MDYLEEQETVARDARINPGAKLSPTGSAIADFLGTESEAVPGEVGSRQKKRSLKDPPPARQDTSGADSSLM